MKNTLKFLSIGFALVLLVMSQQMSMTQPAEGALTEDTVKFQSDGDGSGQDANATAAGTTVKHYAADDVAHFWILDSTLNTVHSGKTYYLPDDEDNGSDIGDEATVTAVTGTAGFDLTTIFPLNGDLADCAQNNNSATTDDDAATKMACVETNTKYDGANTPVVPGTLAITNGSEVSPGTTNAAHASATSMLTFPVVTGTTTIDHDLFSSINETAGTFAFLADGRVVGNGANQAMIASYDFNAPDGIDRAKRRAKVTSTSDSTGEYITIVERLAEGDETAGVTNGNYFHGKVAFSTDAAAAQKDTGTASLPTVWVTDGDTITVEYLAACPEDDNNDCTADGVVTSTATATIDAGDPTITAISPADGTLTNDESPVLSFTINDVGAGFSSSIADFADHVHLTINHCNVVETTELSVTAHSSSSITFSFDLGGTTNWDAVATKAGPANADSSVATTNRSIKCNNGNQGNTTSAANSRTITTSGFYIDDSSVMIEDGVTGAGHTSSGDDRDRTIHGKEFTWEILAVDDVGNTKEVKGDDLELTIDSVAPSLISGATKITGAKAWDSVDEKDVDDNSSIKLIFTETLDRTTVSASDFLVSGTGVVDGTISSVKFGGVQGATDTYVYLDLAADLGPDGKPKVELVGQVSDLAGNVYKVPTDDTDGKIELATALDGVASTLSGGAVTDNYLDEDDKTTLTWTSNENMVDIAGAAGACTCMYVVGGNAEITADGTDSIKVAVGLTTPTSGKKEIQQGATGEGLEFTAGIFGLIPVGEDAADNHGVGGITKVTEDVSKYFAAGVASDGAQANVKISNWPFADHNGNGDLRDDITELTINGAVEASTKYNVAKVHYGTDETIDINFKNTSTVIPANATVKITYYYVNPEHVVEVDTTAPTATITPTNDSSVTNKRQRVTVAFNDDEYAADSHTTTTLTKAELKDPDGVITDIKSLMISSDNKSYYYKPTSDLANGGYTITVSGEDDNGNARNDTTSKFTVKDRDQTVIKMSAGWNLISLPAAPADSAINTVITNDEVNTVLTYDPAIPGGWLTAVRDGGTLAGTLTTVDATRAYWVHQDDGDDIKVDIPGGDSAVTSVPAAISVVKGWNLVPMIPLNPGTAAADWSVHVEADTYFENIDWTMAKTWNRFSEEWMNIRKGTDLIDADEDGLVELDSGAGNTAGANHATDDPHVNNMHDLKDLVPGVGYWVFANKAGTITP